MTLLRRSFYLVPIGGFGLSVVLALSVHLHGDFWITLQLPGLLAGEYISSIHGGMIGNVAMVIVNGTFYSGVLLIACGLIRLALGVGR